jgi:hypothetical protein
MVEGAYTPSKSVFIPPARTMSTSSMQSAPAHIPAMDCFAVRLLYKLD